MFDIFHSMMDAMKLNDYDDDSFLDDDELDYYDDDEFVEDIDEVEEREKEKRGSIFDKLTNRKQTRRQKTRTEDMDRQAEEPESSYDDGYSDIERYASGNTRARSTQAAPEFTPERTQTKTAKAREEQKDRGAKTSSKVTPMRSSAKRRDTYMGPELNIQRPKTMEDAEMVAEELMRGNVVILSIEGLDMDVAQRIVDFTSGCCFALDGTFKEVTSYVFAFTPNDIPVSGDQTDSRGGSIPYVNAGY